MTFQFFQFSGSRKPCFYPLPRGDALTKTAKMTNLHSTHEDKGAASRTKMAGAPRARAGFTRLCLDLDQNRLFLLMFGSEDKPQQHIPSPPQ